MLEEYEITCPYCGGVYTALVDCSAGDQQYIEDCEHCCSPIQFTLTVDAGGRLAALDARRDNE